MRDQERLADERAAVAADAQWMTFAELAAARRTAKGSVARLVRRRGWPRKRDAEGCLRVLVPGDAIRTESGLCPNDARDRSPGGEPGARPRGQRSEYAALRKQLAAAREQASRAATRARQAEQARAAAEAQLAQQRERATRAEADLAAERSARAAADAAVQAVAEGAGAGDRAVQIAVKAEAAQLRQLRQADAARRAQTRWQRLVAAWRGD